MTAYGSKVFVHGKSLLDASKGGAVHDTCLLVLGDALLEEVGLALHGDHLHPRERVTDVVDLGAVQLGQEAVSHELDVLGHQIGVHPDEVHGQCLGDELDLNVHGLGDDAANDVLAGAAQQLVVKQASEVAVQTFVSGDELVGEGQTGHQTSLLEPEDGAERTGEEDAFNGCERHQALSEGASLSREPLHGPVALLLDGWHRLERLEQVVLLLLVDLHLLAGLHLLVVPLHLLVVLHLLLQ